MQREQRLTVWPVRLASGAPEAVLSLRGGCRVLGGRKEGLAARVSGPLLSGLTRRSLLEGLAGGERTGQGDGRRGPRGA